MKFKKMFILAAGLTTSSLVVPFVLTSCSSNSISSQNVRLVSSTNYTTEKYSTLQKTNLNVKDAVYGSSFNSGNYLFVYGTTSNSDVRSFLYGPNGNAESGTNLTVNEQNFSTSSFMKSFYSSSTIKNNNVQLVLFIDLVPYNPNAGGATATKGDESPFDTYTSQEVLDIANKTHVPGESTPGKYTEQNLPLEYRFMISSYKRKDNSAAAYRNFYNYISVLRPSLKDTAKSGGILAFKNSKAPASYSITEKIETINTYYQTN